MTKELIDYLLSKGNLGLLVLVLGAAVWFLFKQLGDVKKVIENNTAALDRMATEVSASVKQNAEVQRSVLEAFVNKLR